MQGPRERRGGGAARRRVASANFDGGILGAITNVPSKRSSRKQCHQRKQPSERLCDELPQTPDQKHGFQEEVSEISLSIRSCKISDDVVTPTQFLAPRTPDLMEDSSESEPLDVSGKSLLNDSHSGSNIASDSDGDETEDEKSESSDMAEEDDEQAEDEQPEDSEIEDETDEETEDEIDLVPFAEKNKVTLGDGDDDDAGENHGLEGEYFEDVDYNPGDETESEDDEDLEIDLDEESPGKKKPSYTVDPLDSSDQDSRHSIEEGRSEASDDDDDAVAEVLEGDFDALAESEVVSIVDATVDALTRSGIHSGCDDGKPQSTTNPLLANENSLDLSDSLAASGSELLCINEIPTTRQDTHTHASNDRGGPSMYLNEEFEKASNTLPREQKSESSIEKSNSIHSEQSSLKQSAEANSHIHSAVEMLEDPAVVKENNIEKSGDMKSVVVERKKPSHTTPTAEDKHRVFVARIKNHGKVKKGKWTLGSKIGSGAFGVVHIGMNTETGTLMAVKTIQMELATMQDVQREVELLRSLDHDNIVRYCGTQVDKQYLRIFQEWVAGGSIQGLLGRFGPFTLSVTRIYLSQTLQGLAYLHENNILHRDIKGSNILVTNEGVVKLADFGASRKLAELKSDMMMSLTMRGTPYFMAPEVFEERYSSKADIWAIGCVAFQMVAGRPPWKDLAFSSPVALFNFLKQRQGPPTCNVSEQGGKTFLELMESCFKFDPSERPTALAMLKSDFFVDAPCSSDSVSDTSATWSPQMSIVSNRLVQSPSPGRIGLSPIPGNEFIRSPQLRFQSPPLPRAKAERHDSPMRDQSNWPEWAKERQKAKRAFHAERVDGAYSASMTQDSLVFSSDGSNASAFQRVGHDEKASTASSCSMLKTCRSPLQGLNYVAK